MGILRRLREWREDKNGTLMGPNIDADSVDAGSLNTKKLSGGHIYASAYDGSTADERLDNALASISNGVIIVLESGATYSDNRTITEDCSLVGAGRYSATPDITASWTLDRTGISISNIRLRDSGELKISALAARVGEIYDIGNGITVSADGVVVTRTRGANITFESGTSNGVANSNTTAAITDNGSNVVGTNS